MNNQVTDSINRRSFLKRAVATVGAGVAASGMSSILRASSGQTFDYIVVGSGPGGGPVAANLARSGYTVALIEAGIDVEMANTLDPSTKPVYSTPGAAAVASEHQYLSWDLYVQHYANTVQMKKNDKYVDGKGILYPRGNTLGGSVSHSGGIWAYPHNKDFDDIAAMTGDTSWNSKKMRQYFEKVERCEYKEKGTVGHGFDGYISTSTIDTNIFEHFPEIKDLAFSASGLPDGFSVKDDLKDVNHPDVAEGETGTYITPMHFSSNGGVPVRSCVREYLLETQQQFPNKLFILSGALASKILFSDKTATGIEYMKGPALYEADKNYQADKNAERFTLFARKEVIVSGGAYNTPQLLMLSGVGPKEELEKHNIPPVAILPGVGKNLQDRYEINVTVQLKKPLDYIDVCKPGDPNDPCFKAYLTGKWPDKTKTPFHGPYATNFILSSRIEKSSQAGELPDLFMFGLPYPFTGYYPGHSSKWETDKWAWLILKAHNENTAGQVSLKSSDPRDMPLINFHYFEEGNDDDESDLTAIVEGIKMVRNYFDDPKSKRHIKEEVAPGLNVKTDQQLKDYIRNQSWGHHASCSAPIGADDDPMAVLDSKFNVRGVERLRVVDASAFPRTPGFFPTAAIYMISEKASEEIIKASHNLPNLNASSFT